MPETKTDATAVQDPLDSKKFDELKDILEGISKGVADADKTRREFEAGLAAERKELGDWRKSTDEWRAAADDLLTSLKARGRSPAGGADYELMTPRQLREVYGSPFSPTFRKWWNDAIHGHHKDGPMAVQKALVGDAGSGAVLVPDEFGREIYRLTPDESVMLPLVTRRPTGTDTFKFNRLTTSATVAVIGQGIQFPYNDPTLVEVTMTLRKYGDIVLYSQELAEDAEVDLTAMLEDDITGAMALFADQQILDGDGSATSLGTGILRDTAVNVTVVGGSGGAFAPTYDNLVDAVALIDSRAANGGAGLRWVFSRTTFAVIRKIKDNDGLPIFDRQPSQAPGMMVLGIPVLISEAAPTAVAALNKNYAFVGNPKHYLWAERTRVEIAVSTEFKFDTAQIAIRVHGRAAGAVAQPKAFTVLRGGAA